MVCEVDDNVYIYIYIYACVWYSHVGVVSEWEDYGQALWDFRGDSDGEGLSDVYILMK